MRQSTEVDRTGIAITCTTRREVPCTGFSEVNGVEIVYYEWKRCEEASIFEYFDEESCSTASLGFFESAAPIAAGYRCDRE